MSRQFTEPKITPHRPTVADMQKDWSVWFRFYDPRTDQWILRTYKKGINRFTNFRERLSEANALCAALKEELQDGWNPLTNERVIRINSLSQGLDYVMNLKAQSIRPKTRHTYLHIIRLFKEWLNKKGMLDIAMGQFSSNHAQEYMDQLLVARSYSARTHNDHLIILSTFFNCMQQRDWILKNPFKGVKKLKASVGRNHAYTESEKEKLKSLLIKKDPWMYYLTQIMYYCFIRRTELARLRVKDIDLVNKTIIIRGEDAKNDSQESVVIPVGLEPVLEEMALHNYPDDFYIFGRHLYPSEIPYANVDHISARHNKFCRQLKLQKEKGLYSHKHTGVCAAYYATGKDIYSLMRQLRHRDMNTTSIYLKSLGLIQNDVFRNAMVA
jgi:integrase/recombinase XerD